MIVSLTEKAEAIEQAEEFKHFGMDLEFLLQRNPDWCGVMKRILFTVVQRDYPFYSRLKDAGEGIREVGERGGRIMCGLVSGRNDRANAAGSSRPVRFLKSRRSLVACSREGMTGGGVAVRQQPLLSGRKIEVLISERFPGLSGILIWCNVLT